MGTGHVMRCLALAQAWQDAGGKPVFAMAGFTLAIVKRIKEEGIEVEHLAAVTGAAEDAHETVQLASRKNANWIIVDGYQFGPDYQRAIKAAGFKLLFIDDYAHAAPYSADLVLNQNLQANRDLYSKRDPSTQLLLGPRYAMLRREFRPWRSWRREIPAVGRKILVTMGGSDPDNSTAKVIEAIASLGGLDLETTVLVGGSNPHLRDVEALINHESMRLITDTTCVPDLMTWADVAITGAGTTFWEMCFLGLPGILLVLAENQQGVAAVAEKMGIARNLGKGSEVSASFLAEKLIQLLRSSDTRRSQSEKGRDLIDGRGAGRVFAFLSDLELRHTVDSDCEVFWEWASDPEARTASFHNETISWEQHTKWFRAKMKDPKAILYTATSGSRLPLGQVRYQIDGRRAVLSISLGARFRGCGLGQKVLAVAVEKFLQESDVEFIDAYVKPENVPSMSLFVGAGFRKLPSKQIEGQEAIHFVLKRNAFA
jgi:UDP-2,4-diacetamido-2,4,6-trideoxy-beta-L-altropyranose hydrolase